MKNWKHCAVVFLTTIIIFAFIGCDDDKNDDDPNEPKNQSATITLFGGASSATVKGYMTNAQWEGIAGKIQNVLNTGYETNADAGKQVYKDIFARGVTYIVELNPDGYTNLKTIGDGKTIYIALIAVDTQHVNDGVTSIYTNGSTVAQIKTKTPSA